MNPFRIASIGAGHIANWGHRAVYTDIQAMLETERPDAVCLVVPEPATARLAMPLLERGIPLLMEKPPGVNQLEAHALWTTANKGNGPHAVAFNRRHMPLVVALRTQIADLAVPVEQIRYEMVRKGRSAAHFNLTAIHGLDLVNHLAGSEIASHHFDAHCPPRAPRGARNFAGMARYQNGIQAQWLFSPMAGTTFERLAVHGGDHSFHVHLPVWGCLDTPGVLEHYHGGSLVSRTAGDAVAETQDPFITNGFYGEIRAFLDAVRAGKKPADDLSTALGSVRLADALEQAPWSHP